MKSVRERKNRRTFSSSKGNFSRFEFVESVIWSWRESQHHLFVSRFVCWFHGSVWGSIPLAFLLHGNVTSNWWRYKLYTNTLNRVSCSCNKTAGNAGTDQVTHKSTTLRDIYTWSYHIHGNILQSKETEFATKMDVFVGPRTACPSLTGSEVQTVELSASCWMEAPGGWAKYNGWVGSHHMELLASLQQNTEPSILSQVRSLYCSPLILLYPAETALRFTAYCATPHTKWSWRVLWNFNRNKHEISR